MQLELARKQTSEAVPKQETLIAHLHALFESHMTPVAEHMRASHLDKITAVLAVFETQEQTSEEKIAVYRPLISLVKKAHDVVKLYETIAELLYVAADVMCEDGDADKQLREAEILGAVAIKIFHSEHRRQTLVLLPKLETKRLPTLGA